MSHSHHHNHDGKLTLAVSINILLTVAQLIGGLISGSNALIADALHNLSDAGAIVIAMVAQKLANKPASNTMTFGYKRAQILGALINSSMLIVVGAYLIVDSFVKFFNPQAIDGWIVVYIAAIALAIDAVTAWLTYRAGAKNNLNLKAAFIHNLSDAMASLVVIVSGSLIILFEWYMVDVIATVLISIYVIYHGLLFSKQTIVILMQGVPSDIAVEHVYKTLQALPNVAAVSHLHVWQLDDKQIHLEANIVLIDDNLQVVKDTLLNCYNISHSTIETVVTNQAGNACYQVR